MDSESTLDIDKIQKRIDRTNEESDDSEERPSKRPRQDLFLADSDDTNPNVKWNAPSAQDIDALFDVEDDIDEEMTFKPLPPALNEEELRSQAEARYRKELPPLTPHQVLPTQLDATEKPGNDPLRTSKDNDSQAKDEKKERRKLIKLDENRLLSRDGFPQLMKMTKDFRIKGKGHEVLSHLLTLLNVHS
jgi:replication fork protection complex subunit Csm3/Swi3